MRLKMPPPANGDAIPSHSLVQAAARFWLAVLLTGIGYTAWGGAAVLTRPYWKWCSTSMWNGAPAPTCWTPPL